MLVPAEATVWPAPMEGLDVTPVSSTIVIVILELPSDAVNVALVSPPVATLCATTRLHPEPFESLTCSEYPDGITRFDDERFADMNATSTFPAVAAENVTLHDVPLLVVPVAD
jgi:hypothetical protein